MEPVGTEVTITEIKSHLSAYLRSVRNGGEILVKDRETPIARIVPYKPARRRIATIPATKSHKNIDRLPFFRPANLKPGDVDEALRWVRQDREVSC
jgi:prevent-host-death family protein